MDNATKAIMIGVGLFITVIIISAVLVVVNLGRGAMNNATNSMGDMLGTLTTPADWNGRENISAETVNNLLKSVEQGKFNYPVTVVKADYTKLAVWTPAGNGYEKETKANSVEGLGINPIYARVGTDFIGFKPATDDTKTVAADTTYKAYTIQSRSNSQIGVLLVQVATTPTT